MRTLTIEASLNRGLCMLLGMHGARCKNIVALGVGFLGLGVIVYPKFEEKVSQFANSINCPAKNFFLVIMNTYLRTSDRRRCPGYAEGPVYGISTRLYVKLEVRWKSAECGSAIGPWAGGLGTATTALPDLIGFHSNRFLNRGGIGGAPPQVSGGRLGPPTISEVSVRACLLVPELNRVVGGKPARHAFGGAGHAAGGRPSWKGKGKITRKQKRGGEGKRGKTLAATGLESARCRHDLCGCGSR